MLTPKCLCEQRFHAHKHPSFTPSASPSSSRRGLRACSSGPGPSAVTINQAIVLPNFLEPSRSGPVSNCSRRRVSRPLGPSTLHCATVCGRRPRDRHPRGHLTRATGSNTRPFSAHDPREPPLACTHAHNTRGSAKLLPPPRPLPRPSTLRRCATVCSRRTLSKSVDLSQIPRLSPPSDISAGLARRTHTSCVLRA